MTAVLTETWVAICRYDDLLPERGAAALVDGEQVALFRTYEGEVFAVSNYDPFSEAYVMSRGIVGSKGDAPTVASPMYKQIFDLRTGECLSEPGAALRTYPVICSDGMVRIGASEPA